MYLTKTPSLLYKFYNSGDLWKFETSSKTIYLTFDDGPIPVVTPWVLDTLKAFDAKATFFCVGDNVKKHPEIFSDIKSQGHHIGNHTLKHLNGWKNSMPVYVDDVMKCDELVNSSLFRPPYGKISASQHRFLKKHFRFVFWTVLSGDFDQNITPEKCLENLNKYTKEGSIIVFHDSIKAKNNLFYSLPLFLEKFTSKGFKFKVIPYHSTINNNIKSIKKTIAINEYQYS